MRSERIGPKIAFLGLVAGLGLVGCGQSAQSGAPVGAPTAAVAIPTTEPLNATPPTVSEAAKVLDLRQLPLFPGSEDAGGRSVARLTYNAKTSPREAYAFHQKELLAQKWAQAPGEYVTDESASGTFTRDGYILSLSAVPTGSGDEAATMVNVTNHGNLSAKTLPQPAGSTLLYEFPVTIAYVTPTPVEKAAAEIDAALLAAGWEPYGTAGDSRFYRQKAIRLTATTSTAPAQDGKTVVNYATELVSAELPAPAEAKGLQYSEPPVQLSVDFAGDLAAADKWYRERLGKMGWEPTTENPVEQGFEHFVIYRNKPGEMLEITFREIDDFTRLMLRFTTAEEFAEMEKRWKEQRKKAEAAK
jgi:hypothetical protein